jgi:S-adenosylmethionine:tRNA ribosyltransferase-isomerase
MKTSDFNYNLPQELIASYPLANRAQSRLLVFRDNVEHMYFKDICNYFEEGDLLVVNNTSVIPARIYGNKESGGLLRSCLKE